MLTIKQPYPYYYNKPSLFKVAFLYFVVIFLFLLSFQPFHVNTDEQKVSYLLICVIHAFCPVLIFYVYFFFLDVLLPEEKRERWTLGNEISHLCVIFFLIGVASFLVRDLIYTNPDNWSWRYFGEEIKNTFLGGLLISSFLILVNFYRLNISNQKQAEFANRQLKDVVISGSEMISVKTQVKADDFTLNLQDFLFAKAEGNYLEIYRKNSDGGVKKELKRMTLSQLEMQLSSFSYIIKTHRAFIVNTRCIQEVTGNAQGYLLLFPNTPEKVPVSRGKIPTFNKCMSYTEDTQVFE